MFGRGRGKITPLDLTNPIGTAKPQVHPLFHPEGQEQSQGTLRLFGRGRGSVRRNLLGLWGPTVNPLEDEPLQSQGQERPAEGVQKNEDVQTDKPEFPTFEGGRGRGRNKPLDVQNPPGPVNPPDKEEPLRPQEQPPPADPHKDVPKVRVYHVNGVDYFGFPPPSFFGEFFRVDQSNGTSPPVANKTTKKTKSNGQQVQMGPEHSKAGPSGGTHPRAETNQVHSKIKKPVEQNTKKKVGSKNSLGSIQETPEESEKSK